MTSWIEARALPGDEVVVICLALGPLPCLIQVRRCIHSRPHVYDHEARKVQNDIEQKTESQQPVLGHNLVISVQVCAQCCNEVPKYLEADIE